MKKLICLLTTVLMVFAIAACGNTADLQDQIDQLQEKIEQQTDDIEKQTESITELENENGVLKEKIEGLENELEGMKEKDDFVLTVSVALSSLAIIKNQTFKAKKGDRIQINATLQNRSGKALTAFYHSGTQLDSPFGTLLSVSISNWIPIDEGSSPGVAWRFMYLGKDSFLQLSQELIVEDQEPGEYKFCVYSYFYLNADLLPNGGVVAEDEIRLESEEITIIVE